jgi:CubicO group peptidase (beta-lactamase class C family)
MYNPPKSLLPRIVPTEIGGSMNRGLIHGEVHDENTFFLNGVSSHAGLFSTAEDLAVVAQMLLNGGIYAHKRLLAPGTIAYWTRRQNLPPGSSRALGWDTPTPGKSTAGDYFGPRSFGHTGFTGTSIWIEPERKVAVILLTNRVHPTRKRGGIYQVRRDFHNAVMKALFPDIEKYTAEEEDAE